MTFRIDAPNDVQNVSLALVDPTKVNVRLFVERESLSKLRARYQQWLSGEEVVLPDPPVLRYLGFTDAGAPRFEILAGERRVTAASLENVQYLPCRIVVMTDEEAFRFILDHNDVAGLTTVELAYRAAEMEALGYSNDEISDALKGASAGRYISVGQMIDAAWFTDEPKLCNPSIVEWFEASEFGAKHFERCFKAWDQGLWDEKQCAREFRRRGRSMPLDNAEKGFRVTFDENRLVIRGQVDLDLVGTEGAVHILSSLRALIADGIDRIEADADFGPREVVKVNPETLNLAILLEDED